MVVVVGGGMGGMTAAITAAERGLHVVLVEKGDKIGGAAAYSGGQVWIGANHVAAREGLDDSVEATMEYVRGAAGRDEASLDPAMCKTWLTASAAAAAYLEEIGAIRWEIIPDYPDYYFPALPGSQPKGRYLTGAPFPGGSLGDARRHLLVSPHFPIGITYGEMFDWGGMSSKTHWDWDLVKQRQDEDILTFGTGIAAALFKAVLDREVDLRLAHRAEELVVEEGRVIGVACRGPDGQRVVLEGDVILATGAHDWSEEYSRRFTGIPPEDGGSVTNDTISGDAMDLVGPLGASISALPGWAAPVLPGYRLNEPLFEGDTGYRACYEHCLPNTFLVNIAGERFCDDSFHSTIVAAALDLGPDGEPKHLPMFMIWDSQHHEKYGMGRTMPGEDYAPGLVTQADTLGELAGSLGVNAAALVATAKRFNGFAREGVDHDFGRGSNFSVRKFRGDAHNEPNENLGTVERAPFFGMRMRLLNTGIAAGGVHTDASGRPLRRDGSNVDGLYVVGEATARTAAGVGYNSGYSLSRAMAFGWIAAKHCS